jgi:hypothetical protein
LTTLVIGDVHGCSVELSRLVEEVQPGAVVLVGDLFTKGPDPEGVYQQIQSGAWAAVKGNHDLRLLQYLDGERPDDGGAARCIERLDARGTSWRGWLRGLPLFIELECGFTVVHAGLHPSGKLEQTTKEMALSLRRWPMHKQDGDFWYNQYRGERKVIFGHDAMRGRVRIEREGEPWLIGLDSGCVYGGELSGYVVEEDLVVSVPAARVYSQPVQ